MTGTTTREAPEARWYRLSPLTVWAGAVAVGTLIGLPALATVAILAFAGVPSIWAVLTLVAAALLAGALVGGDVLRYRRTRYRATEERMEVRSGLLARKHLSLPRDRIRSVDLATPLWARPFRLCQVTVGTGQSAKTGEELRLAYLATAAGERLRHELLYQAGMVPEATPGEGVAEGTAARILAEMRPSWFGYGVAAVGPSAVAYPLALAGVAPLSEFLLRWLLETRLTPGSDAPDAGTVLGSVLGVLGVVAGALVVGALGALALHVEAWWHYRLTREPGGTLLVKRGLLNLSAVSIEERRLRGVEIRAPLPLRWFDTSSVAAVASGLGSEDGGKSGLVPRRTLSPDLPREEAERLAAASLPGAVLGPLTAHPRAALRRRLLRAAVAVAGLTALAVGVALVTGAGFLTPTWVPVVPPWAAAVVLVVTALVAFPYAWGCYEGLGHGLSDHHLYLRRGMVARSTVVLRREAVIGWTIRRSPFQRRAGLATIGATIAADKGVFHAPDVATGEGLAFADRAVPGLLAPFLTRD